MLVAARSTGRNAFWLVALALQPMIGLGAVHDAQVERVDQDHVVVSWIDAAPVSVYQAVQPDAGTSHAQVLSEKNRDGRYIVPAAADKRIYFLLLDNNDGQLIHISERLLPLEKGSNFRDIGGYATTDGRHVRWDMVYRSGATPFLSSHDIAYVRNLGLVSMIDLRSSEERQLAPSKLLNQGIRYIAIDYSLNSPIKGYEDLLTALAPQYRAIFHELLLGKGPISYNCTAGQDRTGVATALVLSALGVPRQIILSDYHLSTLYREPQNEMPDVDPSQYPNNPAAELFARNRLLKPPPLYSVDGRSFLADLFDRIDARWGSVENYLRQVLDVGPGELGQLRAHYLE